MNLKKLYLVVLGSTVLASYFLIPESTSGSGIVARAIYSLLFVGIPMAFLLPVAYLFGEFFWEIIKAFLRWIKK